MSMNEQFGSVGVDRATERLIREYFPEYPDSTLEQLLADPQTALTAALVRQNMDRPEPDTTESQNVEARYYAEKYTVTADGPRQADSGGSLAEPENVNGTKVDLGFAADTFDLRFTDHITVAFKSPNDTHRDIHYRPEDSPVAGKEAHTRYVWLERHDQATSDPTVWIEGDRQ
jgi:hypothetical protein